MNIRMVFVFLLMGAVPNIGAQLLDEKPVSTGGNIVGSWEINKDPLKVYADPLLVAAVKNLQFTGETTGGLVFEANGNYQANYITLSTASGLVSLGLLGEIPFAVDVADTNRQSGTYVVEGELLILTPSSLPTDTLSFSATNNTLQLVQEVPLGEFSQSISLVAAGSEPPLAVIDMTRIVTGPITADFDGSGVVDFVDFVSFAQQFGKKTGDIGFEAKFDLNQNGSVDFGDFVSFAQQFGLKT